LRYLPCSSARFLTERSTPASELDYRAQAEAQRIFGYDESHVGILSSKRVLDDINRLLEGS